MEWLEKYFHWWLRELGCSPMKVTFFYSYKPKEDTNASILLDVPYRHITLSIYPQFWQQGNKNDRLRQEQILIHEALHVAHRHVTHNRLMDEGIFDDYEEEFIDTLSISLQRLSKSQSI